MYEHEEEPGELTQLHHLPLPLPLLLPSRPLSFPGCPPDRPRPQSCPPVEPSQWPAIPEMYSVIKTNMFLI